MKKLFLLGLALMLVLSASSKTYYSIASGLWSNASNWSETPGGSPAAQAPKKGDDVFILSPFDITLDVSLGAEPGISLDIEEGASLVALLGTEGLYIGAQGVLNVSGVLDIGFLDLKNDAVVNIYSSAEVTITTFENGGNEVNIYGNLFVTGTFTNTGVISGTGTVTAGSYANTGTIFCTTTNPPDGSTIFGNGWSGGTPGVENDWNTAANWCSGLVPGDSVEVFIPSSAIYKSLEVTAAAECKNLKLESTVTLTVLASSSLSIGQALVNEGLITLKSDATGTGVLLENGLIPDVGTYTVERYLADALSASTYFHQVCAPVDNQTLEDFDAVHGITYAYEFVPSSNEWNNIWAFSRLISPMKGIVLSTLNNTITSNLLTFTGAGITGNRSVSVEAGGWNLIGNPYPSPIAWDSINPFAGVDNIVYIFDPATNNYVSYVEGTGGNVSCQFIQSGQSFFIYSSAASSFDLTNNSRVLNKDPFLKSDPVNYLRLYTSGGNQSSDEVYIRFLEGATTNYDANMESEKWPSMSETAVTELFTLTDDDVSLQINALPLTSNGSETVPLHFIPAISGNYTIHTEFINSFNPSVAIYLEDKSYTPSLMINLREQSSYSFNASIGNDVDRFVLHFSDEEAYGISDIQESTIRVGQSMGQFIIENPEQEDILEVKVFSITGSEVASYGPSSSSNKSYEMPGGHAAYIVRILTNDQVISRKLVRQ